MELATCPRESAKFIASHSKHVHICKENIDKAAKLVAKGFLENCFSVSVWLENELNPRGSSDTNSVDWIFFVDTLNFSFWTERGQEYTVSHEGKTYTGYWSLCAAINRAIKEGCMVVSPAVYSTMDFETFRHIFRSDTGVEMPLLKERHMIIQDTGKVLMEKFDGSFQNVVSKCDCCADKLLRMVYQHFPSYRDEAVYKNNKVSFYKRAQILIADLWACFKAEGITMFNDIDILTIFADYRVPQVLAHLGVLQYSEKLLQILNAEEELKNGDPHEIEIRGCAIWAAELILRRLRELQAAKEIDANIEFNSVLLDFYLWEYRRRHAHELQSTPYHRCRCIYY